MLKKKKDKNKEKDTVQASGENITPEKEMTPAEDEGKVNPSENEGEPAEETADRGEPSLPQNIVQVGERVFDEKNIYIHQKVYAQIHKFTDSKTENEHGGILVGRVVNEMGKENTIIEGFIEAKYDESTPTTLTFTHETWEHFHSVIDKKYKDKKIVGWIHTHPNFGIFLSENDRFIQENFFTDNNQVAYVVDPIQKEEGFFFWVDEKLERCPGFYIFDKNGVKIKQPAQAQDEENAGSETASGQEKKSSLLVGVLIALLIANLCITAYQAISIHTLKKQVEDQQLVMQYGFLGAMGAPEISDLADGIRAQLKAMEEAQKKAAEDALKQQAEQSADPEAAGDSAGGESTDGNHADGDNAAGDDAADKSEANA